MLNRTQEAPRPGPPRPSEIDVAAAVETFRRYLERLAAGRLASAAAERRELARTAGVCVYHWPDRAARELTEGLL